MNKETVLITWLTTLKLIFTESVMFLMAVEKCYIKQPTSDIKQRETVVQSVRDKSRKTTLAVEGKFVVNNSSI